MTGDSNDHGGGEFGKTSVFEPASPCCNKRATEPLHWGGLSTEINCRSRKHVPHLPLQSCLPLPLCPRMRRNFSRPFRKYKRNKWNLFQEVAAGSSGFLPNNSLKTQLSLCRPPSFHCDCFSCHLHPRDVMHAVSASLWCRPPRFAARVVLGARRAEDTQQLDVIGGVDVLQFRTSAHIRRCLPLPGSVCCSRSNYDVIISGETTRKQQTHPLVYYDVLRYLSCRCGRIV